MLLEIHPYSNKEKQRKHHVHRALKGLQYMELTPKAFRSCTFAGLGVGHRSQGFHCLQNICLIY